MFGGMIAQHLHETDRLAGAVQDRADLAARPEGFAVLAQMPAFVMGGAEPHGGVHRLLGLAAQPILRREQHFPVATENILLGPAEDAMRTFVPAQHDAIERQRKNDVVDGAIENLAALLLAGAQRLLGRDPLRDVGALHEDADDHAVLIGDRLVDEIDEFGFRRPTGSRRQMNRHGDGGMGLAAGIDPV